MHFATELLMQMLHNANQRSLSFTARLNPCSSKCTLFPCLSLSAAENCRSASPRTQETSLTDLPLSPFLLRFHIFASFFIRSTSSKKEKKKEYTGKTFNYTCAIPSEKPAVNLYCTSLLRSNRPNRKLWGTVALLFSLCEQRWSYTCAFERFVSRFLKHVNCMNFLCNLKCLCYRVKAKKLHAKEITQHKSQ